MILTKNELEVMNILWSADRDLTHTEIIELAVDPSWKVSTIHTLINGLLKKNAIEVANLKLSGKVFGRTFIPIITKEEYMAEVIENSFSDLDSAQLTSVFAALIKDKEISQETCDELQKIVNDLEGRLD